MSKKNQLFSLFHLFTCTSWKVKKFLHNLLMWCVVPLLSRCKLVRRCINLYSKGALSHWRGEHINRPHLQLTSQKLLRGRLPVGPVQPLHCPFVQYFKDSTYLQANVTAVGSRPAPAVGRALVSVLPEGGPGRVSRGLFL